MRLLKKKVPVSNFTLREFHNKRNKILIIRELGGLGDILMHRMMFEDFKINSDFKIVFACPKRYHPALYDHPYIDELVDNRSINTHDYLISYNTTTACTRYELRAAPFSGEHRSDIWAAHCGVKLTQHNMHINLSEDVKKYGYQELEKYKKDKLCVMICPISAMIGKNLNESQISGLVESLKSMNYFVCAIHTFDIPFLKKMNVPVFYNTTIPQWMSLLNASDYVISVDTAGFHFAGGIKKPVTGIFTFADGYVYGKYYDCTIVQKHRDHGDWDCGPCYNWANCPKSKTLPKPCLTEITVDMILKGVNKMFQHSPRKIANY